MDFANYFCRKKRENTSKSNKRNQKYIKLEENDENYNNTYDEINSNFSNDEEYDDDDLAEEINSCPVCNLKLPNSENMAKHILSHMVQEKVYLVI